MKRALREKEKQLEKPEPVKVPELRISDCIADRELRGSIKGIEPEGPATSGSVFGRSHHVETVASNYEVNSMHHETYDNYNDNRDIGKLTDSFQSKT